jgi:hypothetical protein
MTSSPDSRTGVSSGPSPEPGPRTRASDADRETTVKVLHDAVARGLLSLDEADERVAAAYAARFAADLPPLTADLPPAPVPAPVAPGWRALAVLAVLQLRSALAGISWPRIVRSRPRLAVAAIVVLALLSFGAVTAGEMSEHGGDVEHGQELEQGEPG